jgi:hypothetical protein
MFRLFEKKRLHHRVAPEGFTLTEGKEYLSLSQLDTKEAKHYFCTVCGMLPFTNPCASSNIFSINVRCLDDFDLEDGSYDVVKLDGRNWEESIAYLNEQMTSSK